MNNQITPAELQPYLKESSLTGQTLALLEQQKDSWTTAGNNYTALSGIKVKKLTVGGIPMNVQFNPSRIVSSAAKVDPKSIQERKCFLCMNNLPEVQKGIPFGKEYIILVNPFPIFPSHLTIPVVNHVDQLIGERFGDMLDLAKGLDEFVLFYNGPKCGASAPDHAHFQAGNKGFMPLEYDWKTISRNQAVPVVRKDDILISRLREFPQATLVLESADRNLLVSWFNKIYKRLEILAPAEPEPMLNVLCLFENGQWRVYLFPRRLHRPTQYFAEGDANLLISPASVDLGGVFITPRENDFDKISAADIADILAQISIEQPVMDALCSLLDS